MQIKLSSLVFDMDIYPRSKPDWRTIACYKGAIATGAIFDPIRVARRERKWTVIDGWHRCEAYRLSKVDTIKAVPVKGLKDYPRDFVRESARLNSINRARELTVQ